MVDPNYDRREPEPVNGKTTALPLDDDRFKPENLRISQDFTSQIGVQKILNNIQVMRPDRH